MYFQNLFTVQIFNFNLEQNNIKFNLIYYETDDRTDMNKLINNGYIDKETVSKILINRNLRALFVIKNDKFYCKYDFGPRLTFIYDKKFFNINLILFKLEV